MSIHPDDWSHARAIFEHALTLPASTRPGYLAEACGSREGLRPQIERMLASHDQAEDFLETPAVRPLTDLTHATHLEGARIGPYQLGARIGGGGMGEVYKAHDPRLGRTVAIKVLPAHAADDPQARDRFEREARAIAALTHPHICALYDVGEATPSDAAAGTSTIQYLVMEHLEGETLAARLARGPLTIAQALHYAVQMASALDQAHRAGIVHRDLKPANVMLVKGDAKLLDFGLAKQRTRSAGPADRAGEADASHQTTPGMILGTVPYMAPEQVEGRDADARTDVFAFGAVLYEMLTGTKAFTGATQANLVAAILEHEPAPLSTVLPSVPPALDRVVKKCLAKDPDERWQSTADLKSALEWIEPAEPRELSAPRETLRAERHTARRVAAMAAVLAIVAIAAAAALWRPASPPALSTKRLSVTLPGLNTGRDWFALSPDGTELAYVEGQGSSLSLHLMALADGTSRVIAGVEIGMRDQSELFFSPDGKWLGFFHEHRLKKIALGGGPPETICEAISMAGASWGADDHIVFSTAGRLWRVPAAGGKAVPLTTPAADEANHAHPRILPGGRAALFTVQSPSGRLEDARIEAVSIPQGERRVLVRGGAFAQYVPTGHLVYMRQSDLVAVRFDPERLAIAGSPVLAIPNLLVSHPWPIRPYDFADDGTLVYVSGADARVASTMVWVDRKGQATPLPLAPRQYSHLSLLPDGQGVILEIEEAPHTLWRYDFKSGALTLLTPDGSNHRAVLSPDGRSMIFSSDRTTPRSLYRQATDGSGGSEHLFDAPHPHNATGWSADGRWFAFTETRPDTRSDIWVLPLEGDRRPRPFLNTRVQEQAGTFSPDGRWMAYASDESGRLEVTITAFPGPGPRTRVSTAGGDMPVFSRDGRQLFYRLRDQVLVAEITTEPLSSGTPQIAFEIPGAQSIAAMPFPITAAGDAILYVKEPRGPQPSRRLTVVVNWFDELRRASAK